MISLSCMIGLWGSYILSLIQASAKGIELFCCERLSFTSRFFHTFFHLRLMNGTSQQYHR